MEAARFFDATRERAIETLAACRGGFLRGCGLSGNFECVVYSGMGDVQDFLVQCFQMILIKNMGFQLTKLLHVYNSRNY